MTIEEIKQVALEAINGSLDLAALRSQYFGKKGVVTELLAQIKNLPPEEKANYARSVNALRDEIQEALAAREAELQAKGFDSRFAGEEIDVTLPGTVRPFGRLSPLTIVEREMLQISKELGFVLARGPEIDTEYYTFDSLNIPKYHPARDMQDTFYTGPGVVMRTHTTSVQARTLEDRMAEQLAGGRAATPIKIISPGKVYRNEKVDATHSAMFHQFEGLWIEEGLTFQDLLGVLEYFARRVYGEDAVFRFKPKYYPYTEPSVGMDIRCTVCNGEGCGACGSAGWLTIVGAGMVHPKVFLEFGYDPENLQGIAFGFGPTRIAAQKYGMDRLKILYENDLRVLRQF